MISEFYEIYIMCNELSYQINMCKNHGLCNTWRYSIKCGFDQFCVGTKAGFESAIQTTRMSKLFSKIDGCGVLLLDATTHTALNALSIL